MHSKDLHRRMKTRMASYRDKGARNRLKLKALSYFPEGVNGILSNGGPSGALPSFLYIFFFCLEKNSRDRGEFPGTK